MPAGQTDKTGTMMSDGAIYSSIDFSTKSGFGSASPALQATPYATTQILHSNSIHELAVDLPEAQWKSSLQAKQEMTNLGYSLPDKNSCNNTLLFIPDYRLADGLCNRMPHNQSQDFSTTSSHNSSERSGSLSGWYLTGSASTVTSSSSSSSSPFPQLHPNFSIIFIISSL
ncbi:roundabout homolog 2 [Tachysurus ichikawai]